MFRCCLDQKFEGQFLFFRLHINVYHMTWVCFFKHQLIMGLFGIQDTHFELIFFILLSFTPLWVFLFLFGATFTLSFLKVACVHCFCWPRKTNSVSFVYPVVGLAHGVVRQSTGHC